MHKEWRLSNWMPLFCAGIGDDWRAVQAGMEVGKGGGWRKKEGRRRVNIAHS